MRMSYQECSHHDLCPGSQSCVPDSLCLIQHNENTQYGKPTEAVCLYERAYTNRYVPTHLLTIRLAK